MNKRQHFRIRMVTICGKTAAFWELRGLGFDDSKCFHFGAWPGCLGDPAVPGGMARPGVRDPWGVLDGSAGGAGRRAAEGGGPYGRFIGSALRCIPAVDEKSTPHGTAMREAREEKKVRASTHQVSSGPADEWSALARGPKRLSFLFHRARRILFSLARQRKENGGCIPQHGQSPCVVPGPRPVPPSRGRKAPSLPPGRAKTHLPRKGFPLQINFPPI